MKKFLIASVCLLVLAVLSCASGGKQSAYSADSVTLDSAINESGVYFVGQTPKGAKLALVSFDTPSGPLSDYIFGEMWKRFEDSRNFVMVDRKNLDRIEAEVAHQFGSGMVSDASMVSLGKQSGAEILIYGQMTPLGNEYRLTVYATDVEKAQSSQRAYTVRPDNRLSALLNVSLDDAVERVVQTMAKAVNQKTTIAVGRITYADTQTVTGLSAWLKNGIVTGAEKQRDKFQVASDSQSADFAVATRGLTVEAPAAAAVVANSSGIQAVVIGSYTPLDKGAEVSMQLVSTSGNKQVLASAKFTVPAAELERRKLSLFPGQGDTKPAFEAKQKAIDPYAGKNNKWNFTVTPDVLDGIYHDGDYMSMRIYSERDCYFRIIHVDVNGATQVIYPTAAGDNNSLRAGQTRTIPDNTRFRMGPPFGEEIILVSAYERPFTASQLSGQLSADAITRGLTVESDNNTSMSPSVTAKFSYTILPAK